MPAGICVPTVVGVPTRVGRRASLGRQAVGCAGSEKGLSYQRRLVNLLVRSGLPKNRRRRIQRPRFAILLCVWRMPAARPHK